MKTEFTAEQLADPDTAVAAQAIRKCVHCGFCTATCPTYLLLGDERDGPRGRITLMKEMLEREMKPSAQVVRHLDRCLSCLACTTTCPSGVDYKHLIDHSRAYIEQRYKRPLSDRILRWALANVMPYRSRLRIAARVGQFAGPLAALLKRHNRLQRVVAMLELSQRASPANSSDAHSPTKVKRRGRVLLMQGCAESVVRPEIRAATVRLLNRFGYDVIFARGEQCCGAIVHHMGRSKESAEFMRRQLEIWTATLDAEATRGNIDAIIITTSGCGTLIKDYAFEFRDDAKYSSQAQRISALAKDISELVIDEDVRAASKGSHVRVAYHSACSLQHGQQISMAPKRLLEAAGFTVNEPLESHLCCGSAGTYNILQPQIAAQLGARKASHLIALQPQVIATGNIGCATQIGLYASIPVLHTIELLDWATGGPTPDAMGRLCNGSDENKTSSSAVGHCGE